MSQVKMLSASEEKRMLQARIKELEANIPSTQNKELKLTTKIGEKGTINIYGTAKFPVCLYFSQLVKLEKLFASPEFKKFLVDNQDKLAKKEDKVKPE